MTSRKEAEERAERIRGRLAGYADDYISAVIAEDWRTLGYDTPRDWAQAELGDMKFGKAKRAEIMGALHDAGFSVRGIAAVLNLGKSTVHEALIGPGPVRKPDRGKPKARRGREMYWMCEGCHADMLAENVASRPGPWDDMEQWDGDVPAWICNECWELLDKVRGEM